MPTVNVFFPGLLSFCFLGLFGCYFFVVVVLFPLPWSFYSVACFLVGFVFFYQNRFRPIVLFLCLYNSINCLV